jgi:hypothetical protein
MAASTMMTKMVYAANPPHTPVNSGYNPLGHPSDPNYVRVLGGSDFGIDYQCPSNCIPHHEDFEQMPHILHP